MPLARKLADLYGVAYTLSKISKLSLHNTLNGLRLKYQTSGLPPLNNNLNTKEDIKSNDSQILNDGTIENNQYQIKEEMNYKIEINKINNKNLCNDQISNTISLNKNEVIIGIEQDKIKGTDSIKSEDGNVELKLPSKKENIIIYTDSDFQQSNSKPEKHIEVKVPTTKIGRLFQYGGLAASMGAGMFSEALKRSVGLSKSELGESVLFSESNVNRLVNRLSKMRGAAQKLGQVLAIQDANVLPPQIEKILFQIQHSGAYMPKQQLLNVLEKELGADWQNKLIDFEMTPFAAASIGQVHWASLINSSGKSSRVAVKVQYPGVATSIDSDLDSLKLLLLASKILPRGLYLDKTIQVTRKELKWETDYLREAKYAKMFKNALKDSKEFIVPEIYGDFTTKNVLTMERIPGIPLNQVLEEEQEVRDWIATKIMELSLRELFEFKFMQTDPNWTNFLYDKTGHKLGLLDFGATREFDDAFLSDYLGILKAASENDREGCLKYSYKLGYLTGDEHTTMKEAHINSILTLAEPFMKSDIKEYDFKDQTITKRVRELIPLMLNMRLTPPPEQTYSLHRKLSGAFLLCARLNAKVNCRDLFLGITSKFQLKNE